MASKELTPLQEAFLEELFKPENKGDFKKAMNAAGYPPRSTVNKVLEALHDEIIERAQKLLAAGAPKAVLTMMGMLEDDITSNERAKRFAVQEILDRVGIVKKEKIDVNISNGGLFFLPEKEILNGVSIPEKEE